VVASLPPSALAAAPTAGLVQLARALGEAGGAAGPAFAPSLFLQVGCCDVCVVVRVAGVESCMLR
jgi:hypothetical protein